MRICGTTASAAATLLLLAAPLATGHTWVEEILRISKDGKLTGDKGYIRNNQNADLNSWKLPRQSDNEPNGPNAKELEFSAVDKMCHFEQTDYSKSGSKFPKLKAAAGDMIAIRYKENGHVTLPVPGKFVGPMSGTVFIYATSEPKPRDQEMFVDIHGVWTADGKGGDGRGKLIATRDYDDGMCFEKNDSEMSKSRQDKEKSEFPGQTPKVGGTEGNDKDTGPNRWCQNDIRIPEDAASGKDLTLYWVWDFSTMGSKDGTDHKKLEFYTSCMEVTIDDSVPDAAIKTFSFNKAQNPRQVAVEDQLTMDTMHQPAAKGPFKGQGGSGGSASGGSGDNNTKPSATGGSGGSGDPAPTPTSGANKSGGVKTVQMTSGVSTRFHTATVADNGGSQETGRPEVSAAAMRRDRIIRRRPAPAPPAQR